MGDASGKWWNSDNGPCNTPNPCSDDGGAPGGGGPKDGLGNPNNGGGDPNPRNSRSPARGTIEGGAQYRTRQVKAEPRESYPAGMSDAQKRIFDATRKEMAVNGKDPVGALASAVRQQVPNGQVQPLYNRNGQLNGGYGQRGGWGLQVDSKGRIWITGGGWLAKKICLF
jgi:hypothetical protein